MKKIAFALGMGVSLSLAGALPSVAHGRQRGIAAEGCTGCHGNFDAIVTMTANREVFEPGDEVTFTVSIERAGIQNAGMYMTSRGVGNFRPLANQNLAMVDRGLTHSAPKSAQAGRVTFDLAWIAPQEPGNVLFEVYALAGNGNGASSGDAAGEGYFSWVYGCEGQEFFVDYDRDGFGSSMHPTLVDCVGQPPEGYSELGTDCNEFVASSHPGAPELCNERDDNCNGEIDEDSTPIEMWPDPDGDGFYALGDGESITGCAVPGYAWVPGDCAPNDPHVHPAAEEVCNLLDDNCDGRVDERVRPQCGVGFCRRESFTCFDTDCTAGTPEQETCNALDDDCDGDTDEGEVCEQGYACVNGKCLEAETAGLPQGPHDNEGGQPGAPSTGSTSGQGGVSAPTGSAPMPMGAVPGPAGQTAAGAGGAASSAGGDGAGARATPGADAGVGSPGCSHVRGPATRNTGGPRWESFGLLASVLLVGRRKKSS